MFASPFSFLASIPKYTNIATKAINIMILGMKAMPVSPRNISVPI
jgi:hypothetical protein